MNFTVLNQLGPGTLLLIATLAVKNPLVWRRDLGTGLGLGITRVLISLKGLQAKLFDWVTPRAGLSCLIRVFSFFGAFLSHHEPTLSGRAALGVEQTSSPRMCRVRLQALDMDTELDKVTNTVSSDPKVLELTHLCPQASCLEFASFWL